MDLKIFVTTPICRILAVTAINVIAIVLANKGKLRLAWWVWVLAVLLCSIK